MDKIPEKLPTKNVKKTAISTLQESLEPYIGEKMTDVQLRAIGNAINSFFLKCIEQKILDKEKWDKDNTIIVQEKNDNEIDIILPDWIYEWMENEEN